MPPPPSTSIPNTNSPPEQIARFQKDGYIKLKNVLSAEVLEHYGKEITRETLARNKNDKPLEERTTYGKASSRFRTCGPIPT